MKRYVLIIIIFSIIAIGSTAVLIGITNSSNESTVEEKNKPSNTNIVLSPTNSISPTVKASPTITPPVTKTVNKKEKTLDLYGLYDQNDIIIEEEVVDIEGNKIKYPQISGLIDKKVESKVNNVIKEKVIAKSKEFLQKEDLSNVDFFSYVSGNFSNVLSITFGCHARIPNSTSEYGYASISDSIGLNFELITGEELKFEDLFKTGEDISIFSIGWLYIKL